MQVVSGRESEAGGISPMTTRVGRYNCLCGKSVRVRVRGDGVAEAKVRKSVTVGAMS